MPREYPTGSSRDTALAPAGFSLIELMVVVAIVGLLAALLVAGGFELKKRAQIRACEALIKKFSLAMEQYKQTRIVVAVVGTGNTGIRMQGYPTGTLPAVVSALEQKTTFKVRGKEKDASGNLVDPWGNAYLFLSDPDPLAWGDYYHAFILYSKGPDRKASAAARPDSGNAEDLDNIGNWQ